MSLRILYNNAIDNNRAIYVAETGRVKVGRAKDNDIVLDSPYVAQHAVSFHRRQDGWEMQVLGLNGVTIEDRQVHAGEKQILRSAVEIKLFPFTLSLDLPSTQELSRAEARRKWDQDLSELIRRVHRELLKLLPQSRDYDADRNLKDEELLKLEERIEKLARDEGMARSERRHMVDYAAGAAVRAEVLEKVLTASGQPANELELHSRGWSRLISAVPEREHELDRFAAYFQRALKVEESRDPTERVRKLEEGFWGVWDQVVENLQADLKLYLCTRIIKKQVKDILYGYGPLEDLLRLPTISEIMVVDSERIYVERGGTLENSGRRFVSDDVTLAIIERIVGKVGRRIDKAQPLVDARLSDGSRVNAVIGPLAVSGPCLTIRRFPTSRLRMEDLVRKGALGQMAAEFLRAAVLSRKNILIAGGTGSGKTTLLNCVSDYIPERERIVTVEDTAELRIDKPHVVRLETKEANIEGKGQYTIRDLVKNSLRMRPDRIVVGECRGGEALDMLQAMNTGHDGSSTTIHANTPGDAILRLEVLVQMAGTSLPVTSIRRQVAAAVDLIVQLHRQRNGRRVISHITEVTEYDEKSSQVRLRDLFVMDDDESPDAFAEASGCLPTFMPELIESGFLRPETFYGESISS